MAGHSDIKTTSDAYLNIRDEDIQAAHKNFSPIANLDPMAAGKKAVSKEMGPVSNRKAVTEDQANKFEHAMMFKGAKRKANAQSPPPSKKPVDKITDKLDIKEEGTLEVGELRLQLFYQELYREHTRKLIDLVGELMNDIMNAKLELPLHVSETNTKLIFSPLKKVYVTQNRELWPFLLKHLNHEFRDPLFETQLNRIAFTSFWSKTANNGLLNPTITAAFLEILLLIKERGTLKGTCTICEGYFP